MTENTYKCAIRDLQSFEIRFEFESAVHFDPIQIERDWLIRKFSHGIVHACQLIIVSLVKRLKPLTALSGTVYRLASSMSDHTPVV